MMTSIDHLNLDIVLTGDEFLIPTHKDISAKVPEDMGRRLYTTLAFTLSHVIHVAEQRCTYLCGNSLGPLAKRSRALIEEELRVWSTLCVSVAKLAS